MSDTGEIFRGGGIIAVIGLVAIIFLREYEAGFFLLGVGVVIMASVSEEFREKVLNLFFSIFEAICGLVKRIFPL